MNSVVFLEWFENQLMPALKNPSLVVLDNASYHNVKTFLFLLLILIPKKYYMKKKMKKKPVVYKTGGIANLQRHGVLRTPRSTL